MKKTVEVLKKFIRPLIQSKSEKRHALVGSAYLWKMKRDFQINFLISMGISPEHYLMDIGCGSLRGGLPLIEYLQKGHYFGSDIRDEVLAEGRKELLEAGLEGKAPTIMKSLNIAELKIEREFDYIWAFSVLIHMDDEILHHTLDFVSNHLAKEGSFFANVKIGEIDEGAWQGFPVVSRSLEFYRNACAEKGLIVTDIGSLKEHGHVSNVAQQDDQRMLRITKG